ncbi:methyltransferase (plasmid) [Legionella adelaidensis]|uniref:Methyltransferase n=1 Tax=Legionella adelaidensis TaxID=45056 RepID=A0A0W0R4R8_9GAMM|nr:class I SAM-dependent methyltransferase [Legionella adelaidensis]KTC66064.1 methyltransferase [Legionella adelaidensis]VEH85718.1 methyltransferase [Legionella adelaidensis]
MLNHTPEKDSGTEFDAYSEVYSDEINEALAFAGQSHEFYTKVKAEYLTEILKNESFSSDKISVLDVGCGHGLIHPFLLAKNQPVNLSGVDVAASVIKIASAMNTQVSYQVYDGYNLPYKDNSFDMAYAICVMHHVPPDQWVSFLREVKRVVKPNGLVVIFEHNPLNPITVKIVKECPLDENATLIRCKKMNKLLKEAGLVTIKSAYILFTPFDKSFFRKIDRQLRWLPLGAQYFTVSRKPLNTKSFLK